jgi:hypothetical protein
MKLSKFNLKGQKNIFNVILGLGLVIVIIVLVQYNKSKGMIKDNMTVPYSQPSKQNSVMASSPQDMKNNYNYMDFSGSSQGASGCNSLQGSTCNSPQMLDPSELLPKDMNSEWANVNPASNDLKNVNMLNPTQLIGINTVGSSLRNANYDLRSEPANPRVNVGPWNQSTIDTDTFRRPLEIGSGGD